MAVALSLDDLELLDAAQALREKAHVVRVAGQRARDTDTDPQRGRTEFLQAHALAQRLEALASRFDIARRV
jgi:hypothetical protein